ncbi:putative cytochrome P450 [Bisporella sp. PMI_857]|nr:putative cytochrome P450 [Bisporella sp. PMI_857]
MALILYGILLTIGWILYGAIWRLYFSPLAKFPGPKLAALTQWYEFYHNIVRGGMFIWEVKKMHSIYGPIVRINPWEIHIQDSEYYDELYSSNSYKRDKYLWFVAGGGSPHSSFETLSHDQHRLRRGAINPFFSKRSISAIQPIIASRISSLSSLLSSYLTSQKSLDLRVAYSALTLDIISSYCFGESFNCLLNEELAEEWKYMLEQVFEKANLIMHFPWLLKVLNLLPNSLAGPVIRHHRNTKTKVASILRHDPETEKNTNTIFHELRDSELPPSEKTALRLSDEGNILIGAGSETTAQVLAVLSFHLLDNPDTLAKLRTELHTVMPTTDTVPSWTQLEQLPYLTAILKESLRISAPVLTRLPRISPSEPLQYGDWSIPAGVPVSMSYYFMHYDTDIFPEPTKFVPERWIKGEKEERRLETYLVPFSKGTRNCAGINLAWVELYLATAMVFRRWELELFETDRMDVDVARDCFVSQPVKESKGVRIRVVGERD